MTTRSFSSLPLDTSMLENISSLNYNEMTPIQSQSLPDILKGKDILAQAKTGSGKTAAFAIGLLAQIDINLYQTQALVICPTRELADQVSKEIRRLARSMPNTKITTLCGGQPLSSQLPTLQHKPHIVVGTPGRLLKHLQKETLSLENLKTVVLDEADRMLDMGFHDDIMQLLSYAPDKKQTLLFSATYPDSIKEISSQIQNKPVDIRVAATINNKNIKQVFYEIQKGERQKVLIELLGHYRPESCVIFCNTKQQCQELADNLWQHGFHTLALHGDLEQKDRNQVLVQFSNKSSTILVATDVAARGIDINDLEAVINYELPSSPEIHVHRIGRTGRAEKKGLAISMYMAAEAFKVNAIEEYQQCSIKVSSLESIKTAKMENQKYKLSPKMVTLMISAGRKNKIRPGDILGALTADKLVSGSQIGKIDIFDTIAYVAVERPAAKQALRILTEGKIKGRKFRVKKLR